MYRDPAELQSRKQDAWVAAYDKAIAAGKTPGQAFKAASRAARATR
jgi:hypothetical protein